MVSESQPGISPRAFAAVMGVRLAAVQRAIAEGRVTAFTRNARGWIFIDAEKAREEWATRTLPKVDGAEAKAGGRTDSPTALAQSTQREREARAKLSELEYARKSRQLVPMAEVKADWGPYIDKCKTNLLGLATRARQRMPHLTAADVAELDALVREALEELSHDMTDVVTLTTEPER